MKPKLLSLLAGSLLTSVFIPAVSLAGSESLKKIYINVSKEGQEATSGDIPSSYANAEKEAAKRVIDQAGKNNANISGGTVTLQPNGPVGTYAEGTGTFYASYQPEYQLSDAITVETWLKLNQYIAGYAYHPVNNWGPNGVNTANFVLYVFGNYNGQYPTNEGKLSFESNVGGSFGSIAGGLSPKLELNKWYHIAYTYHKDRGGQLYMNGEPIGSKSSKRGALTINSSGIQFYNHYGAIDDIRVWNVERTPAEIKENYKKGALGPQTGLVGEWKFY